MAKPGQKVNLIWENSFEMGINRWKFEHGFVLSLNKWEFEYGPVMNRNDTVYKINLILMTVAIICPLRDLVSN